LFSTTCIEKALHPAFNKAYEILRNLRHDKNKKDDHHLWWQVDACVHCRTRNDE